MSQKIAVAVVHGIGRQGASFAEHIKARVERVCAQDCGQDIVIAPVHWAQVMQAREDDLWTRLLNGGPLDFQALRRLMVDLMADALAYQPTDHDRRAYDDIHAVFAQTLRTLAETAGAKAPLCIIAHSLGTVIASNYLYDLQKPHLIPFSAHAVMNDTPLERGETLTLFYTLGSPLALWSLRFDDFGRPIHVPAPGLQAHYPGLDGEWVNFYDRDDVIGFPLKTLNVAYAAAVTADVEVSAGGVATQWNPLSHLEYWTDSDVYLPIGRALTATWKAVNA